MGIKFNDLRRRSIAMLVSWRIIGGSITAGIVYTLASLGYSAAETASAIFICQFTVNALAYYLHERTWNMFSWGRQVVETEEKLS
jgi:uncharacterized membrane protein